MHGGLSTGPKTPEGRLACGLAARITARTRRGQAEARRAQEVQAAELLKEIPAKAHGREVGGRSPTSQRSERAQAAKDAGLSPDQTAEAAQRERARMFAQLEHERAGETAVWRAPWER